MTAAKRIEDSLQIAQAAHVAYQIAYQAYHEASKAGDFKAAEACRLQAVASLEACMDAFTEAYRHSEVFRGN